MSYPLAVVATAYCFAGTTATGTPAGPGTAAVDPATIPLGASLTVPGYGRAAARDTGGAIRGRTIDLWMSCRAARLWGRRHVTVTVTP